MLTEADKLRLVEYVYANTNPVRAHEAGIISSILGHKFGQHVWRVRKNHFCDGCRREMTVLDYFLTALQMHSVEFINRSIFGEFELEEESPVGLQLDVRAAESRIDIATHALDVLCAVCGTLNHGVEPDSTGGGPRYVRYLYGHPGCGGGSNTPRCERLVQVLRIGDQTYSAIAAKLGLPATP